MQKAGDDIADWFHRNEAVARLAFGGYASQRERQQQTIAHSGLAIARINRDWHLRLEKHVRVEVGSRRNEHRMRIAKLLVGAAYNLAYKRAWSGRHQKGALIVDVTGRKSSTRAFKMLRCAATITFTGSPCGERCSIRPSEWSVNSSVHNPVSI
jgi:hypothetical protein